MVVRGEAEHPRRGPHEAQAAAHAVTQLWREGLAIVDRRIIPVGSVVGAVAMALVLVPQDTRIGAHAQILPVSGNVEPAKGSPSLVTAGGLGTDLPRPVGLASGGGEPPPLRPPEGIPGVLPDELGQPSTEGPPEGGEGGGEGDGEPPQPDGNQTAGGGVPQEDRPAVVQPVPEFVRQYKEDRLDGSVWLVDEFKVGDKLAWTAKQISPPTVSSPPPPPPAAEPAPVPADQEEKKYRGRRIASV